MKRTAFVRFDVEALHGWPGAPDGPESFLRHPHRHVFRYRVEIEQGDGDREVEYLGLLREFKARFGKPGLVDIGATSCEQLAEDVGLWLGERYPGRGWSVEVSEDGENGCVVSGGRP